MKIKMFDDMIDKYWLLTKNKIDDVHCYQIEDGNIIFSHNNASGPNQYVMGNNLIWKYFPMYVDLKRKELEVKESKDWFKSITLYNKSTKEWEITEEVKKAEPKDWE